MNSKPSTKFSILFLSFLVLGFSLLITQFSWGQTPKKNCLKHVDEVEKAKKPVMDAGGTWHLFEQAHILRDESVHALQLDKTINGIFFNLRHLCETLDGIPYNDLAIYIDENAGARGTAVFKQEMMDLGKPEKEVDSWLVFYEFIQSKKDRKLDVASVKESIDSSRHLVDEYLDFAAALEKRAKIAHIKDADDLKDRINDWLKKDKNAALAVDELAQFPYWDIDENYGGS